MQCNRRAQLSIVKKWIATAVLLLCVRATRANAIPGDADCNGTLNSDDVAATAAALFIPGGCAGTDANSDGATTAADVVAVLRWLQTPMPTRTATATGSQSPIKTNTPSQTPSITRTPTRTGSPTVT